MILKVNYRQDTDATNRKLGFLDLFSNSSIPLIYTTHRPISPLFYIICPSGE
jgi:hypothetical protein